MANELTILLDLPSKGLLTTRNNSFAIDVARAALCVILKLLFYWLKWIILFRPLGQNTTTILLVLGESLNCVVPLLWGRIVLSFEAAVFAVANAVSNSKQPDQAKNAATKANRKATAILDALQAFLELLIDQTVTSFFAFSKAGCNWPFACGASMAMLCLPLVLQLKCIKLVKEVSADRRQKETGVGQKDLFRTYGHSSQTLQQLNFWRRFCIVIALGLLMFINRPRLADFVLVVGLFIHTDVKLAKLWKAFADAESTWLFLITYSPTSGLQSATQIPETRWVPRMLVSDAAGTLVQFCRIWREGSQHKLQMMGSTDGSRRRLFARFHWRNKRRDGSMV